MHQGVGLLIGNEWNDQFFVQTKSSGYLPEKWVGSYSFWGGGMKPSDKTPYDALIRELSEELLLPVDFSRLEIQYWGEFTVQSDQVFLFHMYFLLLNNAQFQEIAHTKVLEGNGVVRSREELLNGPWIWGLEQVLHHYFLNNDPSSSSS